MPNSYLNNYLKTACELMEIPSTAENDSGLREIVRYAGEYYAGTSAHIARYEHGGKPSIVISANEGFSFDLLMLGHMDVVPAREKMFSPRIESGILHGRGACDMKGEIAVMMGIMKDALSLKENSRPNIALMLTTDEESGGHDGAGYLVDEIGYRAKVVLVPDGGDDLSEVVVKAKGFAHVRISARGISAHGARPWLGENAILKVAKAVENIRAEFSGKDCADSPESEDGHWHNTCVPGRFAGGTAVGVIPEYAECDLGLRFVDGDRLESVFARTKKIAEENGCSAELVAGSEVWNLSEDEPFLAHYRKVAETVLGVFPRLRHTHGADDGRFFANHDIPVIMSRPRSGGQHTNNEWMDIASLEKFYAVYKKFIEGLSDFQSHLAQENSFSRQTGLETVF